MLSFFIENDWLKLFRKLTTKVIEKLNGKRYSTLFLLKYFKLQVKTIKCVNSIENTGNELKKNKQSKDRRGGVMEIKTRGQVKVKILNHAIFLNVNKPLLETLHYFAINGLSWKSRSGTKIEQICLRTNP